MPVFQALPYNSAKGVEREDLNMLTITNTMVTRALSQYSAVDGWQELPRDCPMVVSGRGDHSRLGPSVGSAIQAMLSQK
jgi:hypothetical protein